MRVFISYGKEDQVIAEKLYHDLKQSDITPWMDNKDILGGQNWKNEIRNAIEKSDYFITLLSSSSLSARGFVHKEQKIALDIFEECQKDKIFIIPVRIDGCESSDIRLQELWAVDLFPSYQKGIEQIMRSLSKDKNSAKGKLIQRKQIKPPITGRTSFLPLITLFAFVIISLMTTIIMFKCFPMETEHIRGNYFLIITPILVALTVFTVVMFILTKVYVILTKIYASIQIVLIPFTFLCMMLSIASAAHILDKPYEKVFMRIAFPDEEISGGADADKKSEQNQDKSDKKNQAPEKTGDNKLIQEIKKTLAEQDWTISDKKTKESEKTENIESDKKTSVKPLGDKSSSDKSVSDRYERRVYKPADYGKTGFENTIGMKFVYIPSGEFMMGSPKDEPGRYNDETQHKVTLTAGFYMQTTEVTQGQWKAVMGNNPSYFKDCDDCPVEQVSWNDVQEFIKKLNQNEGVDKYRLPTEAEWEYAARAGTTTPFAFGSCLSTDQANYNGNYPLEGCPKGDYRQKTVPVGSFPANAWGLYDMHGNIWEWVQDIYSDDSVYIREQMDPIYTGQGSLRVIRGGSWYLNAQNCRSAGRYSYSPDVRYTVLGFRLAGK